MESGEGGVGGATQLIVVVMARVLGQLSISILFFFGGIFKKKNLIPLASKNCGQPGTTTYYKASRLERGWRGRQEGWGGKSV